MSTITKTVGERLRARRISLGYSQEKTAEIAGLHPTYIGQLERGEKNATLESIAKICIALQYPMEQLFKNISHCDYNEDFSEKCYSLISGRSRKEQKQLYHLLITLMEFKKI